MVKAVGSKQRDVKNANHRLILTQLRQHDLLSRSELARMLSLSAPSISKNVDDLIGRNVLIETGTVATNVGRRPSLVGINRQYGCVAAVDFSSTDIRIAISNMKADMIDYGTVPGESRLNMSHLEQTIALLGEMLERHQMRERLLAISIGTPGDIDRQTGYFLYAPRFESAHHFPGGVRGRRPGQKRRESGHHGGKPVRRGRRLPQYALYRAGLRHRLRHDSGRAAV